MPGTLAHPLAPAPDAMQTFDHLKSMILSNAKLLHGASKAGHARTYDVVTETRFRAQKSEYRVTLVAYEEIYRAPGKTDVDSKVLKHSAVKFELNAAMEELMKRVQEEVWGACDKKGTPAVAASTGAN